MIYELLFPLSTQYGWASLLNVLRYTPFRAIMATITAMLLCFFVAPWFIQKLRGKQISQIIREEGPESHLLKEGTPTMGGALILLAVLVPHDALGRRAKRVRARDRGRHRRLRRHRLPRRPHEDRRHDRAAACPAATSCSASF